jgi:multidrug efflux pump subunit AcrA (membrane-fusion protein)
MRPTSGALLLAPFVLLFTGCYLFPREEAVLAPPLIPPTEVTYDVVEVERSVIEDRVTGSGTFVSVDQTNHYFRHRGGRLKVLRVSYGDSVRTGQVIAELDTVGLESEIRRQELAVRKAQLAVDRLDTSRSAEYELELARVNERLARLALADVERDREEARLALEVEPDNNDLRRRLAALESARQRQLLEIEKAEIAVLRLEAEQAGGYAARQAQLDLEAETLKLEDLRRELEEAKLRAELDGEVVYINTRVEEGDAVSAYQTLITIANPRDLRLQYSGFNAGEFLMGMEVEVTYEDEPYVGEVVMTPATVPFDAPEALKDKVHIRVDRLPDTAELGDYASLSLTLARKEDVIVLPRRLVRSYLGRRYVQIIDDGVVSERDVQVGLETPTEVEIVRGLDVGQQVVVR